MRDFASASVRRSRTVLNRSRKFPWFSNCRRKHPRLSETASTSTSRWSWSARCTCARCAASRSRFRSQTLATTRQHSVRAPRPNCSNTSWGIPWKSCTRPVMTWPTRSASFLLLKLLFLWNVDNDLFLFSRTPESPATPQLLAESMCACVSGLFVRTAEASFQSYCGHRGLKAFVLLQSAIGWLCVIRADMILVTVFRFFWKVRRARIAGNECCSIFCFFCFPTSQWLLASAAPRPQRADGERTKWL